MIVGSLIYQSKLSFILDFGRNPTIILVPDKEVDKIAKEFDRDPIIMLVPNKEIDISSVILPGTSYLTCIRRRKRQQKEVATKIIKKFFSRRSEF